jgi:DNA-directed RNA polymerase specialized sigma24 family protein
MKTQDTSLGGEQRGFPQTLWDVLSRARDSDAAVRREGLEALCRQYWKPVYHYVRMAWAKTNEDAKDLTQAFFLWLTEGDTLARYQPERASFRAYLKGLLKHFVQHQDDALRRLKRGGGVRIVELDGPLPLKDLVADPSSADPESIFDGAWRTALVAGAIARVRERLQSRGRGVQFQVYEAYELLPPAERPTYADLARRFGIKEKDVDNHLVAVREELRSEVRREIGRLTVDPDALEREWNALFGR